MEERKKEEEWKGKEGFLATKASSYRCSEASSS